MRTKKCRFVFLLFSTCKKEAYRSRSGAKKLDCSITGNITLTKQNSNGIDYIYDCDEEIYCGAYTIPKSGIAEFLNEDGIRGTNSGVLTVNGSAGDPIITRTSKSTQMYRLGLSFENNNTANELNYLQISNIKLNTARVKRAENELAKAVQEQQKQIEELKALLNKN